MRGLEGLLEEGEVQGRPARDGSAGEWLVVLMGMERLQGCGSL